MSFLNGILAFGALAFSVPLVIHLLTRSRFQQVDWGAMHLLDEAVSVNSRRMKLEQFLLLLLRCLIPILLALCLARPVLTGAKSLLGDSPQSLVVLLDDSYSMDVGPVGATRLDVAKAAGEKIIRSLAPGSEIAVLTTGGTPTWLTDKPMFDPLRMSKNLSSLPGGSGASRMEAALDQAFATVASMSHATRKIVLLSDFQVNDWQDFNDATYARFAQQIEALPIKPSLSILRAEAIAENNNVAVESLELSRRLLAVGQPLEVRVNLRNFGDKPVDGVSVLGFVDGVAQPPQLVTLAPKSGFQTTIRTNFDSPGSHVIEVRLEARDAVQADNRRAVEVTVMKQIPVALFDGDRRNEPLKSDTDFLTIALAPYAFGGLSQTDAFVTKRYAPQELNEQRLQGMQAIVLANVDQMSDEQVRHLEKFAREGGCLFFFLGNRVRPEWYNQKLFAAGQGLLPVKLDAVVGEADKPDTATQIANQRYSHIALEMFNRKEAGDLATIKIRQWYRLLDPEDDPEPSAEPNEPNPKANDDPSDRSRANVLASLETGDPLLVESRFGKGTVLLCATTCDADWTDLPTKPAYLPLMQQLIASGVSQVGSPRNLETGEAIVELVNAEQQDTPFELVTPLGNRVALQPQQQDESLRLEYLHTQRPGVYQISASAESKVESSARFAVNSPVRESDFTKIEPDRLNQIAEQLSARTFASVDEYLADQSEQQFGREIWRWLLLGLLGLMFGELLLQQWFTRDNR